MTWLLDAVVMQEQVFWAQTGIHEQILKKTAVVKELHLHWKYPGLTDI